MLFITEDKLREEYKKIPFESYLVKKGTKITPQARQFLVDFRIRIIDESKKTKKISKDVVKQVNHSQVDMLKINLAIALKKFAFEIKDCDKAYANEIAKRAKQIYENKAIEIVDLTDGYATAIDIFMKSDLTNNCLIAFNAMDKLIKEVNRLKDMDSQCDRVFDYISNDVTNWFIILMKGGDAY